MYVCIDEGVDEALPIQDVDEDEDDCRSISKVREGQ